MLLAASEGCQRSACECPRDPQVVAPGEGRRPSCRSAEGPNAAPGATVNELRQPEAARTFTSATSFDRLERRRARRDEEAIGARNQEAELSYSIFWLLARLFLVGGQQNAGIGLNRSIQVNHVLESNPVQSGPERQCHRIRARTAVIRD